MTTTAEGAAPATGEAQQANTITPSKTDTPPATRAVPVETVRATPVEASRLRWYADIFEKSAPTFCGESDERSSVKWVDEIKAEFGDAFRGEPPSILYKMAYAKLVGAAAKTIRHPKERTLEALFAAVVAKYPLHHYQERVIRELRSGKAFNSETRETLSQKASEILDSIGDWPSGPEALALALEKVAGHLWSQQKVHAARATRRDVESAIGRFEDTLLADTLTKLNLGSVDSSAEKKASKAEVKKSEPVEEVKNSEPKSRNAKRRANRWKSKKEGEEAIKEVQTLKAELRQMRAANASNAATAGPVSANTRASNSPQSYINTNKTIGEVDGRLANHWTWLEEVKIGTTDIKAVADPGAEISLLTLQAADRLGLTVHTDWRPRLIPAWARTPHTTEGYVNVRVEIADGPKRWTKAAVIDRPQKWEMLVGNKLLKELDVELVTPAMRRRQRGSAATGVPTTVASAGPAGATDIVAAQETVHRPITDEDYADFPVPERTADIVVDDEPIELIPDANAVVRGATVGSSAIQPRKMRVKLGLPADYFVHEQDSDFHRWNALYPAVSQDEVAQRVVHQLGRSEDVEELTAALMSGAEALRDYPSGCPPPAAIRPIAPPMRPDAKLIYTVQHRVSEAATKAREEFVKTRLEYGIDEPTRAHCQMPVFTQPKPNTTATRVLFDDSGNNCLNMVHVGVELATWFEIVTFLRDAMIVTSVDLASFFTTIRLDSSSRPFWCYQSGSHNRLQTCRLVQGNSESPAIAQAFLEHVLGPVPELQGKLLIYIDNIYLKSIDGDLTEHIRLIGVMTRALAKYNLLLNLKKSVFAATSGVDILGMMWSADGSWQVPDRRVETLQDLPMPRTVSEIRRLAGGINSISRHMPWVQAALMPFYQLTSKARLTKDDLEALGPHWETLHRCLLNVEHLHIPQRGAPLTLRVDAASAGVGAVLLAQKSEDPEDLAPVAYFSKNFDGMQGYRHSTWREAKAVVEAAQYFYPFLDGCANLIIESDAAAVIGLFSHKTLNDADDLSRFRMELTSLGVTKDMLVHRPGVRQETADWLSRARENIRPRKPTKPRKPKVTDSMGLTVAALELGSDDDEDVILDDVSDSDLELSDDDLVDTDDEGTDEHEVERRAATNRRALRPLRQGGVGPGDAEFTRARTAAALGDMPLVAEFLDCQAEDDTLRRWRELCAERARRSLANEDITPEFDEVRDMRVHENVLQHAALTREIGLQARWVPALTTRAARAYAFAVHAYLGHPGYARSLAFVRERVWSENLPKLVQNLVHTCRTCQLNAVQHHIYTPMEASGLPKPREHIYVDVAEPGLSDEGARYVLIVRDAASGFMEAYPLENQTAATVTEALAENWLTVHGDPLVLTSDNGLCFTSAQFGEMLQQRQIRHVTTTTYHPQSDLAEISVRLFKAALRKIRTDSASGNRWVRYIPRICAAHAVTYSATLGCTPLERFYGREPSSNVRDPNAILERGDRELPSQIVLEQHMEEQTRAQHEAVRRRVREEVNNRRKCRWFNPGELVTLKRTGLPGVITTQHTRRAGPFTVERRHGTTYFLSTARGVPLTRGVSGDLLLPYRESTVPDYPSAEELRAYDTDEDDGNNNGSETGGGGNYPSRPSTPGGPDAGGDAEGGWHGGMGGGGWSPSASSPTPSERPLSDITSLAPGGSSVAADDAGGEALIHDAPYVDDDELLPPEPLDLSDEGNDVEARRSELSESSDSDIASSEFDDSESDSESGPESSAGGDFVHTHEEPLVPRGEAAGATADLQNEPEAEPELPDEDYDGDDESIADDDTSADEGGAAAAALGDVEPAEQFYDAPEGVGLQEPAESDSEMSEPETGMSGTASTMSTEDDASQVEDELMADLADDMSEVESLQSDVAVMSDVEGQVEMDNEEQPRDCVEEVVGVMDEDAAVPHAGDGAPAPTRLEIEYHPPSPIIEFPQPPLCIEAEHEVDMLDDYRPYPIVEEVGVILHQPGPLAIDGACRQGLLECQGEPPQVVPQIEGARIAGLLEYREEPQELLQVNDLLDDDRSEPHNQTAHRPGPPVLQIHLSRSIKRRVHERRRRREELPDAFNVTPRHTPPQRHCPGLSVTPQDALPGVFVAIGQGGVPERADTMDATPGDFAVEDEL